MINNAKKLILYTMIVFIGSYGGVAIVYSMINDMFFEEYGVFSNNDTILYVVFMLISLLLLFLICLLTTCNKKFVDFRITICNRFFFKIIFIFYFVIYLFSFYDFIMRYNITDIIYGSSFLNIISTLGYKVANSDSKLSYTLLSFFPIIFYGYLSYPSRIIRLLSKVSFIIITLLLFLVGRKEQFFLAFILLLIFIIKSFKFNKKTIYFIILTSLVFFIGVVIFLNSVRGDLNDKGIFDILFNSQESYPIVLSAYLSIDSNIDVPLDILVSSLSPISAFSGDMTTMGYIRQVIFGEGGHGPVYTVIGFSYFYFPLSILLIAFVNNISVLLINTFRSFGDGFLGFTLFIIIKYFIFLRNGNFNFFILDLILLFCFSSFFYIFKPSKGY